MEAFDLSLSKATLGLTLYVLGEKIAILLYSLALT
jgi:hypothetical protein